MADQPFSPDELAFLQEIGLVASAVEPLPAERQRRIAGAARAKLGLEPAHSPVVTTKRPTRPRWTGWLTAAAAAVVTGALALSPLFGQQNIALAMERAVANLQSYHGKVELQWFTEDGTPTSHPMVNELWEMGDAYRWVTHSYDSAGNVVSDITFVSDGDRTWSASSRSQSATIDIAVDTVRLRENLGVKELARFALRNPYQVLETEVVAGRQTKKLAVTTPDGQVSELWIDTETNLPLRVVERHRDGYRRVITYTQLEVNPKLEPALFAMTPPEGYAVKEMGGQWMASEAEAAQVAGFQPISPGERPQRIAAWPGRIAYVYEGALLYQRAEALPLWTTGNFVELVGRAGDGPLISIDEGETLSWHQGNLGMVVEGPDPQLNERIARSVAPDFFLPAAAADLVGDAQVKLDLDLAAAEAERARVEQYGDWMAPADVADAWLGAQFGPVGYQHHRYELSDLQVSAKTLSQAVVEVPVGPISRLYVKRVLESRMGGIWSVVGYDKR